jgi:AraC-like DNA-binding protein
MYFADKTVHITGKEIHFLSMANCIVSMELDRKVTIESVLIFFDNATLGDFHLKHKGRIAQLQKSGKKAAEPFLTFPKDGFINSYIASLQFLIASGTPPSDEMKRLKLEELLLYLLERYPSRLLSFPLSRNRELEDLELAKAVEANITNPLSLGELAFMCNLSVSTFKRRFLSIYGMAPRQWFIQKRMEMAKELILKGGQKPSEIYDQFGYESHSSFSQSFKHYFGITPSELID